MRYPKPNVFGKVKHVISLSYYRIPLLKTMYEDLKQDIVLQNELFVDCAMFTEHCSRGLKSL